MTTGTHVTGKRIANHNADKYIAKREAFVGSNLEGGWSREYYRPKGWMPSEWWYEFNNDLNLLDGEEWYGVYSYGTVIAWWTPMFGWVVPSVSYSITTAKHQNEARRGAGYEYCSTLSLMSPIVLLDNEQRMHDIAVREFRKSVRPLIRSEHAKWQRAHAREMRGRKRAITTPTREAVRAIGMCA